MSIDYSTGQIRFSRHAQEQAGERGTTMAEIEQTIREGVAEVAKNNRLKAKYTFNYGAEWHGRFYALKQVEPVFVEEEGELVVITVYTYYF